MILLDKITPLSQSVFHTLFRRRINGEDPRDMTVILSNSVYDYAVISFLCREEGFKNNADETILSGDIKKFSLLGDFSIMLRRLLMDIDEEEGHSGWSVSFMGIDVFTISNGQYTINVMMESDKRKKFLVSNGLETIQ